MTTDNDQVANARNMGKLSRYGSAGFWDRFTSGGVIGWIELES